MKTASAIHGNFYITGDRGSMDEDGYIWFMGRSDDVIISSGFVDFSYSAKKCLKNKHIPFTY